LPTTHKGESFSGAGTILEQGGGKTKSAKVCIAIYGSSLYKDCFLSLKSAFSKKKTFSPELDSLIIPKFSVL